MSALTIHERVSVADCIIVRRALGRLPETFATGLKVLAGGGHSRALADRLEQLKRRGAVSAKVQDGVRVLSVLEPSYYAGIEELVLEPHKSYSTTRARLLEAGVWEDSTEKKLWPRYQRSAARLAWVGNPEEGWPVTALDDKTFDEANSWQLRDFAERDNWEYTQTGIEALQDALSDMGMHHFGDIDCAELGYGDRIRLKLPDVDDYYVEESESADRNLLNMSTSRLWRYIDSRMSLVYPEHNHKDEHPFIRNIFREFMVSPRGRTLKDLVDKCGAVIEEWHEDQYERLVSGEAFEERADSNDWRFDEDGELV